VSGKVTGTTTRIGGYVGNLVSKLFHRTVIGAEQGRVLATARQNVRFLGDRVREIKAWERDYFMRTLGPVR